MFHISIAQEAKFSKLTYVGTSNRKLPPPPHPPSRVLFGISSGRELWWPMSNAEVQQCQGTIGPSRCWSQEVTWWHLLVPSRQEDEASQVPGLLAVFGR